MTAAMLGVPNQNLTASDHTALSALRKIMRDIRVAGDVVKPGEARYLVDLYYQVQEFRKASASQIRSMQETDEPNEFISWVEFMFEYTEGQIKLALNRYTNQHALGVWCKSVTGVGPVIAAGLMAHIDIARAPSVTSLWRYAGYDPTSKWLGREGARKAYDEALSPALDSLAEEDGFDDELVTLEELELITNGRNVLDYNDIVRVANHTNRRPRLLAEQAMTDAGTVTRASLLKVLARRPWNARLRTLGWKIGDSFNKNQNRDNDHYGWLIVERKHYEWRKNIAGDYAEQASVAAGRVSRNTEAYAWYAGHYRLEPSDVNSALAGVDVLKPLLAERKVEPGRGVPMLPPGHIQGRAQRWAVKIFLSHYHAVASFIAFDALPAQPYALAHLDHVDELIPPCLDVVPGLEDAYRRTRRPLIHTERGAKISLPNTRASA